MIEPRSLRKRRRLRGILKAIGQTFLTFCTVIVLTPVRAETPTPAVAVVTVGDSVTVALPRNPQFLSVEDPEIASAEVLERGEVRVTGKKIGETRLVGRDFSEVPLSISVLVRARPEEDLTDAIGRTSWTPSGTSNKLGLVCSK